MLQAEKLCLFCKEFHYEPGQPDWSEWTPGYTAIMRCRVGCFDIDLNDDTLAEYRRKILTAQNCAHFQFDDEIDKIKESL